LSKTALTKLFNQAPFPQSSQHAVHCSCKQYFLFLITVRQKIAIWFMFTVKAITLIVSLLNWHYNWVCILMTKQWTLTE